MTAAALPDRASSTSREHPWPVRTLTRKMVEYIARAPTVWVEGQIAQLSARNGSSVVFLTLRDPSADVSLQVRCPRTAFAGMARAPVEGDRVVVHGRFDFYAARGSLNFRVDQGSGRMVVTVTDGETGEVIRQVPGEEALKMAQRIEDMTGLLDEKA